VAPLKTVDELLHGKAGLPNDRSKRSSLEVSPGVNGNGDCFSRVERMRQNVMASDDPIDHEPCFE
jgi:hypothetical protein